MMTLITGGSGSGKSAYAEDYLLSLAKEEKKYYIATMQIYDAEGERKVMRHRDLRRGKGFQTIEAPRDLKKAAAKMEPGAAALLECLSNVTANEMFTGESMKEAKETAGKVLRGIEAIRRKISHLVLVTNNVFEDGITYDEGTMEYLRALGMINTALAEQADQVVEVVVGIPVVLKGREK